MVATSPSDAPKMVVVSVTESASINDLRLITVKRYRSSTVQSINDGSIYLVGPASPSCLPTPLKGDYGQMWCRCSDAMSGRHLS
jgi:hypothetical protein